MRLLFRDVKLVGMCWVRSDSDYSDLWKCYLSGVRIVW